MYPFELERDEPSTKIDLYLDLFLYFTQDISKDAFLKGNILLNKLIGEGARGTKDLDFDVVNPDIYNKSVKPRLVEFADACVQYGLADRYRISELTSTTSGGVKIYKDDKLVYGVDVGSTDNMIFGVIEYQFEGEYILGSSINKIVAEKSMTTLSEKRYRRLKDFYDLYIICNSGFNIDYKEVSSYILKSLNGDLEEYRKLINNYPFDIEILTKAEKAWTKFTLTDINGLELDKPKFLDLYRDISIVYMNLKGEVR